MVTEALRKLRELFAFGLLAVAALYLVSGLSLLLKSGRAGVLGFAGGLDFAGKSAAFGYLFASPVLIVSVAAAVALVAFGTPAKHARIVAMIGLAIAGVALLLAVIAWLASFADTSNGLGLAGGVLGAGKIVGSLLGLAQLLLLALTTWFGFAVFSALPKAARQTSSWGQAQGYGAQQPYGQPTWEHQDGGYGQPQAWGQPSVQAGWQSGPPAGGQVAAAAAAGWAMPEQGQPASAWVSADPAYGAPLQGEPGWSAGGQHPPQWYPGTPAAGQWQDPQGSPPPQGGQQWTQPETEPTAPLEGGQQHWAQAEPGAPQVSEPAPGLEAPSEADASPEPQGSIAADLVGSQGSSDEEPEGMAAPEPDPGTRQRRGWWQGPEQ